MDRHALMVVSAVIVAGVLVVAGFGFAYEIYVSQQNCQQMDARPNISANCWAFPNRIFVAGGILFGLSGIGLLAASTRWYQNRETGSRS
jgi:hypothetical protein